MPQPIDMQSELGRTMAAERVQDAAARAAVLAQQRSQIDEERRIALRERQVAETPETESEGVSQDGRGKQLPPRRQAGRSSIPAGAGTPRPLHASGEDHALDVTV
jgi:hypothetical protein